MQFSKMKKFFASALVVSLLVVAAAFVASAAYTEGTVNVGNGWWKGRFTSAGSNSVPSYGTWATQSVSTAVSFSGRSEIKNNVIWGRGTITQYGSIVLNNSIITQHNYSGNRVTYAEWLGKPCTVYGQ